jgi:hypothetical protein
MTRKDFELIAKVMRDLEQFRKDRGAFAPDPDLKTVSEFFADELQNTNPLFDRARFLTACGVN